MMKIFFATIITMSFFIIANAQPANEIKIRQVMRLQEKAWNTANIKGFMQGYWQSDSLMFIGKSGVTYGWQKTLDNYKKNYPDSAAMGKLTFNLMELKPLSSLYYFVTGKWHLQRTAGDLEGYFTLLFKRIKNHWVIVADHSS